MGLYLLTCCFGTLLSYCMLELYNTLDVLRLLDSKNIEVCVSSPCCLCWISFPLAPQVIRKIRGETFADSSGHLKLWCQFFNVLSDSTIQWYKNERRIAQTKRK